MSAQTIGLLSGGLVFLSIVPYALRTYQGKIQPVPTSWALWSLIGLAILLTYRSSGAQANIWPAVFGFANPTLIAILGVWRHAANGKSDLLGYGLYFASPPPRSPGSTWSPRKLNVAERLCFLLGIVALAMWLFVRHNSELSQYALCVAIVADLCAAIPTIVFVWAEPGRDRPFAWVLFAVGCLVSVFAIPENTLANWVLPLYMAVVALAVALPLALYRFRQRTPLRQWA